MWKRVLCGGGGNGIEVRFIFFLINCWSSVSCLVVVLPQLCNLHCFFPILICNKSVRIVNRQNNSLGFILYATVIVNNFFLK